MTGTKQTRKTESNMDMDDKGQRGQLVGEIKGDSMYVRSKGRVGVWVGIRRWGASKGIACR
jgi:hypothetical protein